MPETQTQSSSLEIPFHFKPRSYQAEFFKAMTTGKRRACLVWHRRAGKDKTVINYTVTQMVQRKGIYFYFFPTYAQGKKILWDGIGKDGFKFLHHFPQELLFCEPNQTEMKITFKDPADASQPGSIFQIIGTDNMDSVVGTNPVGCVFSEYALQNPKAWDFVRPILKENGGWAVFVYTPRGKNHGWRLWDAARRKENQARWYTSILTVDDTKRDAPSENGKPI